MENNTSVLVPSWGFLYINIYSESVGGDRHEVLVPSWGFIYIN